MQSNYEYRVFKWKTKPTKLRRKFSYCTQFQRYLLSMVELV